jgi:hypothetical protein
MPELGWTASEVMQEILQNLVSQGYMTVVELATCRVSEDPTSPALTGGGGGEITERAALSKKRFNVPSHRYLHSLLQFYSLELHHMSPLWILHMASFVTLCEAYMGIEPHFNLWNYFRAQLQLASDVETVALGKMDIFV